MGLTPIDRVENPDWLHQENQLLRKRIEELTETIDRLQRELRDLRARDTDMTLD